MKKENLLMTAIFMMVSGLLITPNQIYGVTPKEIRKDVRETRQDVRDVRKDVRDVRKDVRQITKKTVIGSKTPEITGAKITAISGSTLTVAKKDITYTVNTSSSTKFVRRYFGTGSVSELSVSNIINIRGTWGDEAKTVINATYIRDYSTTKRLGAFVGNVISKGAASFSLQTTNRETQTVEILPTTKFTGRLGAPMTYDQIKVGDKVEVRGTRDTSVKKIYGTTHVRDFNYPVKAATPSPSL